MLFDDQDVIVKISVQVELWGDQENKFLVRPCIHPADMKSVVANEIATKLLLVTIMTTVNDLPRRICGWPLAN